MKARGQSPPTLPLDQRKRSKSRKLFYLMMTLLAGTTIIYVAYFFNSSSRVRQDEISSAAVSDDRNTGSPADNPMIYVFITGNEAAWAKTLRNGPCKRLSEPVGTLIESYGAMPIGELKCNDVFGGYMLEARVFSSSEAIRVVQDTSIMAVEEFAKQEMLCGEHLAVTFVASKTGNPQAYESMKRFGCKNDGVEQTIKLADAVSQCPTNP